MPSTKPPSSPRKRPEKKIKILHVKRTEQRPFLLEYFYPFLGILLVVLTFFLWAFGYRFDEAAVIAVWVVGIIFVGRQTVRFFKNEPAPKKAEAKPPLASMPSKKYTPPALPRVSKDFRPMPPKGDKRYPPPSPFIKPPK
jgi:hypothetical protein